MQRLPCSQIGTPGAAANLLFCRIALPAFLLCRKPVVLRRVALPAFLHCCETC